LTGLSITRIFVSNVDIQRNKFCIWDICQ